jgi:hypothetical protein
LKIEPERREAEESTMLEAVARERLVKTQWAVKRFSGWCGDYSWGCNCCNLGVGGRKLLMWLYMKKI